MENRPFFLLLNLSGGGIVKYKGDLTLSDMGVGERPTVYGGWGTHCAWTLAFFTVCLNSIH